MLLVLALITWEILAANERISPLLSSPHGILNALILMEFQADPPLHTHLLSTLVRTIIATGLGVSVGFCLGVVSSLRARYLLPIAAFMAAVPGLVWLKMFMAGIGLGEFTLILVGAALAMTPMMTHTEKAFLSVPRQVDWAARLMGADAMTRIFEVFVMSALPILLTGLRLSFARAWRALIVAEFGSTVSEGLGFVVLNARAFMAMDRVLAGVLLMGLIFFAVERLGLQRLEREVARKWGRTSD